MSPNIKSDPEKVTLSQSMQNMDQVPKSRRNTFAQGIPHTSSRIAQDELSSQDLRSSTHHGHGTPNGMTTWALNDADVLDNISSTNPESPEVQLLSFSLSQQLMPPTVGPSDMMYQPGTDFPVVPDMADHNDLDFSPSQDFHHQYSSMVDFTAFDNDACAQNGAQSCSPAGTLSSGQSTDDSQFVASNDAWNSMMTDARSYHGSSLDQFSRNIFQPAPASPPLTESGNDGCTTSASSHSGYPAFVANDDALMKDMTATRIAPLNPGDPLFPLSPTLSAKDRDR